MHVKRGRSGYKVKEHFKSTDDDYDSMINSSRVLTHVSEAS